MFCTRPLIVLALISASTGFATRLAPTGAGREEDVSLRESIQRDVGQLGLSPGEVRALFGNLDLPSAMLSTGCHSLVAARLSGQCTGARDDDSSFGEEGKRSFAISLTLCSMSAALQPIPTECKSWISSSAPSQYREGSWGGWSKQEVVGDIGTAAQQKCLSALYRSSQDWTTYNGYLRDATQLCFALHGRHESDMARAAYVNATQEKITLLRHLQKNEAARAERDHERHSNLTELLYTMRETSDSAAMVARDFALQGDIQETHLRALAKAVSDLHVGRNALWSTLQEEGNELLNDLMEAWQRDWERRQSRVLQMMDSQLDEVHLKHSSSLDRSASSLQKALVDAMSGFHQELAVASADNSRHMVSLTEHFLSMSSLVSAASESMSGFHIAARSLDPLLASALSSASSLQTAQEDLRYGLHSALVDSRELSTHLIDSQAVLNDTLASLLSWKTDLVRSSPSLFGSSLSLFSGPTLFSPKLADILSQHNAVSALLRAVLWTISFLAGFLYTVICVLATLGGTAWAFLHTRLGRRINAYWVGLEAPRPDEETSGTDPFRSVGSRRAATYSLPHTPAPPAYRSPEVIPPQQNRTCNQPVRPRARPYQPKRMTDVPEDTPSRMLVPLDNALGLQLHPRPNVLLPSPDIVERVNATRRELGMGRVVADRTRGVSAPPFLGV